MSDRSGGLIGVDALHDRLHAERLRIADVRWYLGRPGAGRAAYHEGHIPGAVFVDLDSDLSDEDGLGAPGRHPLPKPGRFARKLGELGFGSDDFIVAYDDAGGTIAARLWWMLDNLGHRGGSAVLDGGIQAWVAAGHQLSRDEPDLPEASTELRSEWHNVIERAELAGRLDAVTLLDARAPERYRGEVEPIDPAAGHIPGALNAPSVLNLDVQGRMRPSAELAEAYAQLIRSDRPTVVSCGSGVTACHAALAMRVAGHPDPILYVGSFSDWTRSGMPVVTGSRPGRGDDGLNS